MELIYELWSSIPEGNQTVLIRLFWLSVVSLSGYIIYLLINYQTELHKPSYLMQVIIDNNRRNNTDSSQDFLQLYNLLHLPHKIGTFTMELHSTPSFKGVLVTSKSLQVLSQIKTYLSNLDGFTFREGVSDPLKVYAKPKKLNGTSYSLKGAKRYGNFSCKASGLISKATKQMNANRSSDSVSIIVAMRPINIKLALDIKINTLRNTLYDSKRRIPNQYKQHKIDYLTKKNSHLMYKVKPMIITNNSSLINQYIGFFNLTSDQNNFYPSKTKFILLKSRQITQQNVFDNAFFWSGISSSTMLNSQEISALTSY